MIVFLFFRCNLLNLGVIDRRRVTDLEGSTDPADGHGHIIDYLDNRWLVCRTSDILSDELENLHPHHVTRLHFHLL